ncbi:sensor histidine kinase [Jiella mangrovi]|uniref:Blue-light-activated histidine kinase n=1 Tax=Jiella mangrovi TaxID=2821407 RepID=A0ABS4BL88_9HYPH|nr:PAS domain-containing protein [Jiella mangrovi]MBP0617505.1 PAS domain-containing protein [Jiella mangrovi]
MPIAAIGLRPRLYPIHLPRASRMREAGKTSERPMDQQAAADDLEADLALDFFDVFDLVPTPLMVLDRSLRYVAVNGAYEKATGRQREELLGNGVFEMFPGSGESERQMRRAFADVLETGVENYIALIPYEIQRSDADGGEIEMRYWSANHSPILDGNGNVRYILQHTSDVTDIVRMDSKRSDTPATPALMLWQNAENVQAAYRQTLAENDEFRRLFSQAPGMIVVFEGEDLTATFVSESFSRFIGQRPIIAASLVDALPELENQEFAALLREALSTGKSVVREGMKIVLRHPPGDIDAVSFVDIFCNPVRDGDGAVYGVFVQGVDRTEAFRAAHHQRMLMDELNHRVKNTLATIQSMARQTFRDPVDLDAASYAFEARIMALSRVHNILAERRWEGVPLTALLCGKPQNVDPGRVTYQGADAMLSPRTGVALAIVIHELFANARSHGALRAPDGRIDVAWAVVGGKSAPRLTLTWREYHQTHDCEKLRPGFGLRIIRSIIEGDLDGSISLDLAENGLICAFEVGLFEVATIEL